MSDISPAVVLASILGIIGPAAALAGYLLRKKQADISDQRRNFEAWCAERRNEQDKDDREERRRFYDKIEAMSDSMNKGFRELGEREARTEARLTQIEHAVNGGFEARVRRAVSDVLEGRIL